MGLRSINSTPLDTLFLPLRRNQASFRIHSVAPSATTLRTAQSGPTTVPTDGDMMRYAKCSRGRIRWYESPGR